MTIRERKQLTREGAAPAELKRRSARRLSRSFALPRQKRGVVLLIVVSLLSLFILLGVTYMVTARLAYNTSRFVAANGQRGDAPETEVDLVVGQILYDTAARTVLQYHSLLRDLYGDEGKTYTYPGAVLANGGLYVDLPPHESHIFLLDRVRANV